MVHVLSFAKRKLNRNVDEAEHQNDCKQCLKSYVVPHISERRNLNSDPREGRILDLEKKAEFVIC